MPAKALQTSRPLRAMDGWGRSGDHLWMGAPSWSNDPRNQSVQAEIAANKRKNRTRDYVIAGVVGVGVVAYVVGDRKPTDDSDSRREAEAANFLRDFAVYKTEACACKSLACWDDVRARADRFFRAAADRGVYLNEEQAAEKMTIMVNIAVCKEGLR